MKNSSRYIVFIFISLFIGPFFVQLYLLPKISSVIKMAMGSDRVLLDQKGEILQVLRTDFSKRRLAWHPLSSFSQGIQESVIKAEDQRFYAHWGIDPIGMARALKVAFHGGRIQGASTITMQLTDLLRPEVMIQNKSIQKGTLWHKIIQCYRALALEVLWSKQDILEAYLNLIPLRGEIQGFPAASFGFLNKHPLAVDPLESVVFASSISSPNLSIPLLKEKACRLLKKMDHEKIPSCSSLDSLISVMYSSRPKIELGLDLAPHLARRLFEENPNENIISSNIDLNLQKTVISILEKNTKALASSNVKDAAAIVIENSTGKVIAYVGAVSSSKSPHVDGVRSYRQAGSSLKPFLYAKAFDSKTMTAASILLDEPTVLNWNNQTYRPLNYDKHFNGAVSAREALASSLNVPAVKVVTIIGLNQTYSTLKEIGLSEMKEPDFYGVSMALGAVDVRLDELANAYRIFSHQGQRTPLQWVSLNENKTIHSPSENDLYKMVFSPESSYIISSILSDPNARSTGFGWESPLDTPFWTAVKTGTSKDYRDNWCVGISEKYTVGVWAGNFDATPMDHVSGVAGAGPSWYEIMSELHRNTPSHEPPIPKGISTKEVKFPWVSRFKNEFFIEGTEPQNDEIEIANNHRLQFVYPAENSVLVKDPHLKESQIALSIRFTGTPPPNAILLWNSKNLGKAESPFIIDNPPVGKHKLEIRGENHESLGEVHFTIKGL